ncbi:phosphomannomutase [Haloglomus litoreum]|uniref:phosphomannomutase n=1 Tax=Haloglomus litoreum TaxID=3034026 RepID=UPI0023E7E576|nr:phosphomannomutase [Haloglomus sp. DT116]
MDLFGTAGIRGSVRERVTPAFALRVGRAAAREARADAQGDGGDGPVEFVVGRDGRETGEALASALTSGLQSGGARVVRVGRVPTPALAYASRGRHGVMVTASHNPPTDNGLKLFADGQEYDREAERRIEAAVADDDPPVAWDDWGEAERVDILPGYRRAVVDYARGHGGPLDGVRVAADAGNGVAARAVPWVLRELGAHVVTLNGNVDGHFPGRESKPTPESLADLRAFVADGEFALGMGFDGDADRIVVVDADGEVVHEDTVLAVVAEHYTRAAAAGDPVVVTTPNASARIDERVRAAGGRVERVRLGALHEGVAAAREAGGADTEVVFAAEPWKHMHTRFGPWIDGVASAAVLARLVAESGLDALRDPVTERPYRKVSVECPDDRKAAVMSALETALPAEFPDAAVDTEHGVRLEIDGGWTLVRPSGTEPYVRVYAEHDDVDALVERTVAVVEDAVADAG